MTATAFACRGRYGVRSLNRLSAAAGVTRASRTARTWSRRMKGSPAVIWVAVSYVAGALVAGTLRVPKLYLPKLRHTECAGYEPASAHGVCRLLSRHGFEVFDLGNSPPQLLLQAHDDGHDRARAAGAGAGEPDLDDAAIDADDLDRPAVEVERGADLFGEHLGDAVFEFVGGHVRPAAMVRQSPSASEGL